MANQRTNEDQGYKIRGAAAWAGSRRREREEERPRSPPRGRGGDGYRPRYDNDDHHHRPHRRDWGLPRPAPSWDNRLPRGHHELEYAEPVRPPLPNGDEDVANDGAPWRLLLLRGLKTNTDEATLAKGLEKLYLDDSKPEDSQPTVPPPAMPPPAMSPPPGVLPRQQAPLGAKPQTLKRVFLIRDREDDRSLGFGFAEYHTSTAAVAALDKAKQMGESYTISSTPIQVCHPHLGIFRPLLDRHDQQYAFEFNHQQFTYRDRKFYASSHTVNAEPPAPPAPPPSSSPAKEANVTTKPKKRKAQDTLDNPTEPTRRLKAQNQMVMQLNRAEAQSRGNDGETEPNDANTNTNTNPNPNPNPTTNSPSGANHYSSTTGTGKKQSFAYVGEVYGTATICCFLCGRKFKERMELEKHVLESPLHAKNYKDDKMFKEARERLKAKGISEDETLKIDEEHNEPEEQEEDDEQSEQSTVYRDRAAERRQEEAKQRAATAPAFKSTSIKEAAQKKSKSVGLQMLQKAGWQEGQSLGDGTGITAPIEQEMFAQGVGLGHEGSKKGDAIEEAARQTKNDRGDFVEKTKDAARKRYEEMQ